MHACFRACTDVYHVRVQVCCMHALMHARMYVRMRVLTHMDARVPGCMRVGRDACMRECVHAYMHACMHAHTYA